MAWRSDAESVILTSESCLAQGEIGFSFLQSKWIEGEEGRRTLYSLGLELVW